MIDLRRATRLRRARELWFRLDSSVRYLPLAAVLFAVSFLPSVQSHGTQVGGVPDRDWDALAVVAVALQSLSLILCRRSPAGCLALVSAGFAIDQLRGYHALAGTALPIAVLSVAFHLRRRRRVTVLALTAAYLALVVAFYQVGPGEPISEFVAFYVAVAVVWGIGVWLRSVWAAEVERRRHVAEATRAAERTRIARELHDVVTHHVTAMVVQAEAARYLTAAPDQLDTALTAVTDTGRRAITDLRHLLDLLNPDHGTGTGTGSGGRTPHVGRLLTLVEQTRQAGQPVEFTEDGTPATSTGSADLVAYRVVQEALTNALKYAHGSRTAVRVRHGERDITVEVSTAGGTPAAAAGAGRASFAPPAGRGHAARVVGSGGRGLAGLRERVDVLGGEFSAGAGAGGDFVVRARIPAGSAP